MAYKDLDLEQLQQDSQDAKDKKALFGALGNMADNYANVPTAYELLKGKSIGPKSSLKGTFDSLASGVEDPWEKQKKTFEMYKSAKDNEELQKQNDPDSSRIKALKASIIERHGMKPSDLEGLNEKDLASIYGDPGKLAEAQAQNMSTFANQKALKQMEETYGSHEKALDRKNELDKERLKKAMDDKNIPQNVFAAATFGTRLEDANKQMGNLMGEGKYDPTSVTNSVIGTVSPEFLKPQDMKLMEQAQRNFINAVLRRESGSAISASEFDSGNKQYFPQPGDGPDVLAEKARNRNVAIAGLKAEGAKALPKLNSQLAGQGAPMQNNSGGANKANATSKVPVKKEFNSGLNKTRITYSDGSQEMIDGRQ
jgi:hypothetical protein